MGFDSEATGASVFARAEEANDSRPCENEARRVADEAGP